MKAIETENDIKEHIKVIAIQNLFLKVVLTSSSSSSILKK